MLTQGSRNLSICPAKRSRLCRTRIVVQSVASQAAGSLGIGAPVRALKACRAGRSKLLLFTVCPECDPSSGNTDSGNANAHSPFSVSPLSRKAALVC
jgi:hypothetical protein